MNTPKIYRSGKLQGSVTDDLPEVPDKEAEPPRMVVIPSFTVYLPVGYDVAPPAVRRQMIEVTVRQGVQYAERSIRKRLREEE